MSQYSRFSWMSAWESPAVMVVLCLQLFQEIEGAITEHLFGTMASVGKQDGNRRIDHQEIEGAVGQMLLIT